MTVRQVAINAVMAGCLPEQMPVLLATIEAYQKFNLNSMLRRPIRLRSCRLSMDRSPGP